VAEFQLIVPYKPLQTKVALTGVVVALPVWSLAAPFLLGAFATWVFRTPNAVTLLQACVVSLTLLAIIILGFVLSAMSEDDKIHLSKDGISFPPFLLGNLGFRRNWRWQSLTSAGLLESGAEKYLVLGLGQHTLPLAIKDLQSSKLEELLLALELWGTNCKRSPELLEFQREIQNEGKAIGGHGQTQMWQDELGRRFTATTFVPLEPGRKLQDGRLKVIRQLAFGGLSAIYLVQKNGTDLFVLKEAVVPPNADVDVRAEAERHLHREAEILFSLSHPNIAHVLDHFVEDGRHYLLMEYINGTDLRQLIKQNGGCAEKQVFNWARKMAHILAYLHENVPPVIHRDLTPDNLVLRSDGEVILIDFGASNQFVGTATGTLVGKQAYIAPEQLRGKATPQSDLYALGGTLYFLLTGRDPRPLSQADIKQILPNVSAEMESIITSLTAFECEERCLSARDLLTLLDAVEDTDCVLAGEVDD
jgi:tRNA A-37 threonylcarbamoyl transferase component Bud32